jgi:hypothetical protein
MVYGQTEASTEYTKERNGRGVLEEYYLKEVDLVLQDLEEPKPGIHMLSAKDLYRIE